MIYFVKQQVTSLRCHLMIHFIRHKSSTLLLNVMVCSINQMIYFISILLPNVMVYSTNQMIYFVEQINRLRSVPMVYPISKRVSI